jgi:UDP-GlcNAc:undecaprenyl-phosphate GlcNAc-1-phosphate transferase
LPDELRLLGAVLLSFAATFALTPAAIRLARRTAFLDHPVGYKAHAAPTAYLGGAAVIAGFLLAALVFGGAASDFAALAACTVGLLALGTLDDRIPIRPLYRLLAEVAAAVLLWKAGLGWDFLHSGFEELILTVAWVVGFTNAFNLMDNMDGAASTVGAVCAAGIGSAAATQSDILLAALALALAGACLGFLPYNLRARAPARIFLGDGGSIPIGFALAAMVMNIPAPEGLGWPMLLAGALLLGVLFLDTLLVVVSRSRRGVSLMTGGCDHLSHRLHFKLPSARAVALVLALTQASISVVAILALESGRTAIVTAAVVCLALGAALIALLESAYWATAPRTHEALAVPSGTND